MAGSAVSPARRPSAVRARPGRPLTASAECAAVVANSRQQLNSKRSALVRLIRCFLSVVRGNPIQPIMCVQQVINLSPNACEARGGWACLTWTVDLGLRLQHLATTDRYVASARFDTRHSTFDCTGSNFAGRI